MKNQIEINEEMQSLRSSNNLHGIQRLVFCYPKKSLPGLEEFNKRKWVHNITRFKDGRSIKIENNKDSELQKYQKKKLIENQQLLQQQQDDETKQGKLLDQSQIQLIAEIALSYQAVKKQKRQLFLIYQQQQPQMTQKQNYKVQNRQYNKEKLGSNQTYKTKMLKQEIKKIEQKVKSTVFDQMLIELFKSQLVRLRQDNMEIKQI